MPSSDTPTRKLAAIMFTDIAGYTELSARDEEGAFALIEKQREILKPIVSEFSGEWLKEMGDGLLLSFPSSKQVVNCAIKIQHTVKEIDELNLRIGIHQGDILEKDGDVFGDDVNVAARIEPISAIGGIAVSEKVVMDLMSSPEFTFKFLGLPELKGIKQRVKIFALSSHSMPLPNFNLSSLKNSDLKPKKLIQMISIFATVIISALIFYSYPYIMPLLGNDKYSSLKIDELIIKTEKKIDVASYLLALNHGIEKKLKDNGRIRLLEIQESKIIFPFKTSRYLLLNSMVIDKGDIVDVSFTLYSPDGSIFDKYEREFSDSKLKHVINTLIEVIPVWTLKTMATKGSIEASSISESNQYDYPIEYYELLALLSNHENIDIQNAIIKLEEIDIIDNSSWIDLMTAEAYTIGYINNNATSYLNMAKDKLNTNDFTDPVDIGYEWYIKSLINYSNDNIEQSLISVKKSIKADKTEKRYREFHHKIRSIKLNRMASNDS